mmetsp:Transcript_39069/g.97802  ORF Transcript_39069/g.97802 Transcript_39069/m.97802 type:complete len:248 (-) Transcript_39069:177-920(-)
MAGLPPHSVPVRVPGHAKGEQRALRRHPVRILLPVRVLQLLQQHCRYLVDVRWLEGVVHGQLQGRLHPCRTPRPRRAVRLRLELTQHPLVALNQRLPQLLRQQVARGDDLAHDEGHLCRRRDAEGVAGGLHPLVEVLGDEFVGLLVPQELHDEPGGLGRAGRQQRLELLADILHHLLDTLRLLGRHHLPASHAPRPDTRRRRVALPLLTQTHRPSPRVCVEQQVVPGALDGSCLVVAGLLGEWGKGV